MPPHTCYVEPFAGSLAVLFAKPPDGVSETVNDLDGRLTNFWEVLRDEQLFPEFLRLAQATPCSEVEWRAAAGDLDHPDPVRRAFTLFVRYQQSHSGAGRSAPVPSRRTRRGMNEHASRWLSAIDGLPEAHERLSRVYITCRDAIDLIGSLDGPETLFYLDPPYVHETRSVADHYRHEMTEEDHARLLAALWWIEGSFLLSGYDCPLYADAAQRYGWHCLRWDVDTPTSPTRRRSVECIWANYPLPGGERL
jgi:DNA adenine methylase